MIFDGHADILTDIHEMKKKGIENIFKNKHLENFKKGNIKSGIFVIWIDPYNTEDTRFELIETMAHISNEILTNKDIFKIIKNRDDLNLEDSSTQIIMGIEGLKCIGDNLNILDMLYMYGIRHVSLTWNEENLLGTGVDGDKNRGITTLGIEALKKLENLNMLIDVSHANQKTFWDIVKNTKGTLIASHSNSKSICNHKRNLEDNQLKAIANRDGVVGINIHKHFISKEKKEQNIERLIDHIDHMKSVIGINHIGFGFDFCEYLDDNHGNLEGLDNASNTQNIIEKLRKKGYKTGEIERISYKNFYRVIKQTLK